MHELLTTISSPFTILALLFLTAFAESLAIVGLIVPGVLLLFLLATQAQQHGIALPLVLSAGASGAFLGDLLSFWLGRRYQTQLLNLRLLRSRQKLVQRGQRFCSKYGVQAILIARFIGPIRPVVPLIVGGLNFPIRYFLPLALIGSILFAPVYLLPGYTLSTQVPHVQWWAAFVIAVCLGAELLFWCTQPLQMLSKRWLCWLGGSALCLFLGLGFALLDPDSWLHTNNEQILDSIKVQFTIEQWRVVQHLAGYISRTGNTAVVTVLWLNLSIFLIRKKRLQELLALSVLMLAPFALKAAFGLERPITGQAMEATLAYPSGHTFFALMIGLLAPLYLTRLQASQILQRLLLGWAILVASSRLFLQVHWPTDLFGGLMLAICCYCAMLWIFPGIRQQHINNTEHLSSTRVDTR